MTTWEEDKLVAAAVDQGLEPKRALALAAALERRLAGGAFYVFRSSRPRGEGGTASARSRQVVAFATADAAIAFAQLNSAASQARVRALSIAQLLAVQLQEPSIRTLLLIPDSAETLPAGRLPDGLRIQRDALLRELRADAPRTSPDTSLFELN